MIASRSNRGTLVAVLLLGLAVLLIYTPALGRTLYLHYDEVYFALQAHAIAVSGHDTNGRLLPVYFEASSGSWFQPAVVYFTALFLKVFPLSEAALRLPTVFIALFDVVLIYFIARHVFERGSWAAVAAVALMLSPAHFIFGRLALSYLYPVCALLGWLLCLIMFLEREKPWLLLLATACLGFGFFTYIAAVAMMPLYLCITCIVLLVKFDKPWKLLAVALAGFAGPVLLSLPFHVAYPQMLFQKVGTYGPSGVGHQLDPLQHLSELLNYNNLSYRVSLFFSFFNPGYLFLNGAGNPANSTRRAGVFLLPLMVFIPVGMYHLLRHRRTLINVVILIGFVTAPLAAILVAESEATDRELEVLPFGVLLATFGIQYLWSAPLTVRLRRFSTVVAAAGFLTGVSYAALTLLRRGYISHWTPYLVITSIVVYLVGRRADATRRWRPITACLLALGLLEFWSFYRDYLTDYPARSAGWFMNNRRGALEEIFAHEDRRQPTKVFISRNIQYAESYWQLYASMFGREELQSAMVYFDPDTAHADDVPDGALVLLMTTEIDRVEKAFGGRARLVPVKSILEPDGTPFYAVLKKQATSVATASSPPV